MKGLRSLIDLPEATYERTLLRHTRFAIVSDNCWGYEVYQRLGRPYNTPFVGNFMYAACYLAMLSDDFPSRLPQIKECSISRYSKEQLHYPVGVLPSGAEVHFLHEKTWLMAYEKWQRRCRRLIDELATGCPLFFKFCERGGATADSISAYLALPLHHRITISTSASEEMNQLVVSCREAGTGLPLDGLSLYRRRYEYMDIVNWLRTGDPRPQWTTKLLKNYSLSIAALKKFFRR